MSNMLSRLMGKKDAEISAIVSNIDATTAPRGLRRKFEKIRSKKQGGFTLLELLVVVAILAAIAGTATIMLHDTDKKAFAAAHVGMMDELSKGILTFAQLNNQQYPDRWDSLLTSADGTLTGAAPTVLLSQDLYNTGTPADGNINATTLTADDFAALEAAGIKNVRVIDQSAEQPIGTTDTVCTETNIRNIINSKTNDVVTQNIFRPVAANGCGADADAVLASGAAVMQWIGANERVNAATGDKLIAFGIGPDSTLFEAARYGAMTSTPIYRHVEADEYNRFIVLFNVGSTTTPAAKATLQAIIDGAGDTKDEELGEFDNVRPT